MEKQTHLFKAEVAQMLDLVINSLYSKKEIFLRELLSNASDAIDRAKYLGLVDKELVADNPEWRIDIRIDKDKKQLTISDNGYGMDAEDMEKNLGVIASSGTKAFMKAVADKGATNGPEMIGRFGVGFYAAFMVAGEVSVVSKKRGETEAAKWTSTGAGSYTIEPAERAAFGTDITLTLREDQADYLDAWRIRELVKNYSDFIAYPIRLDSGEKDDKEKDKPINTMTALWKRAKKDVKKEEYDEFYKHQSHDWKEPFEVIHFAGEGQVEFKALLFIPQEASMEIYNPQSKHGLSLYVRNVFIGDDFDLLLPDYLRFVKGVVDSSDLPLNVSREMLQDDAVIRKIKQAVTSKVLSTLEDLKKDAERYAKFYAVFGRVIKEGIHTDYANADRIKKLLMYPSAKTEAGKMTSLEAYVKAMPEDQKDIYYLAAENEAEARCAPQIEQALAHGADVLFFVDPVDEWLAGQSFRDFEGKTLVDIAKGDVQFGTEDQRKEEKAANEKAAADLKDFLAAIAEHLKDDVAEVRVSTRLTDSPCCLVASANALSPSMVRMMKMMNQEAPVEKRILEINAKHPLVQKMKGLAGDELNDAIDLLHAQALVAEGSPVRNPGRFAKLLTALMMK